MPLSSQPWGNALPFLVFSKHILVGSLTEGLVYEGTSGRLRIADREVLYDLVVVVLVDVVFTAYGYVDYLRLVAFEAHQVRLHPSESLV